MDDLLLVYNSPDSSAANAAISIYRALRSKIGVSCAEPMPKEKGPFKATSPNFGVILTLDVFTNDDVLNCIKAAAEGKKNIVVILWAPCLISCTLEGELEKTSDGIREIIGKAGSVVYIPECADVCIDLLISKMKMSDTSRLEAQRKLKEQEMFHDILMYSAKVSKSRLASSVRKKYDFCITCCDNVINSAGCLVSKELRSAFKYSPALSVVATHNDPNSPPNISSADMLGFVRDSLNLVVMVTKDCFTDKDLCEEIRVALEGEVQVTIVHYVSDCPDLDDEIEKAEDPVHRSCLRRSTRFPFVLESPEATLRDLLNPSIVKTDDNKTPRTRAAGVPTFRLGFKNNQAVELPGDGQMPIYKTGKEDKKNKKSIPGDVAGNIKALFELYDSEKTGQVGWEKFVEVDRVLTESLGAQYSEMISRRIYSLMLYPGLTMDSPISYTTFYNYHAYVARQMGIYEGDKDVAVHYKYMVDKARHMKKGKRFQKKYDLIITMDKANKKAVAFASQVMKAIREYTPNLRASVSAFPQIKKDDKKKSGGAAAAADDTAFESKVEVGLSLAKSSLNVLVLMTPDCLKHKEVHADLMAAQEAQAQVLVMCDASHSPEMLQEFAKASEDIRPALSRPPVSEFWERCEQASATRLLHLLYFPDWRPQAKKDQMFKNPDNPLALFLYQQVEDDEEASSALTCLANMTSPSSLNTAENCKTFLKHGGVEVLAEKFQQFQSAPGAAEAACRAVANLAQDTELCKKMTECNIVNMVVDCMNVHSDLALLQGEACRAVSNLAQEDTAKARLNSLSGFQLVLQAQKRFFYDPPFWDGRFAMSRLEPDAVVMVNIRGKGRWCSGVILESYSNGTYDVQYAHGGMDRKVPAHFVRPKGKSDQIEEFCGVWLWKPNGRLTEDELILKPDGMCSLRSGAVGTWNVSSSKAGARTGIKLNVGSNMLEMERISVTTLRATSSPGRAVMKEIYPQCLYTEYFSFAPPQTLGQSMPSLYGRKPDKVQIEQLVLHEEDPSGAAWTGLPDSLSEFFAARWTGILEVLLKGEYHFFLDSHVGTKLYLDDRSIIDNSAGGAKSASKVNLLPGQHRILVEYFCKEGKQKHVSLQYSGPDTNDRQIIVPAAVLQHSKEQAQVTKKPGLIAEYWPQGFQGAIPEGVMADIVRVEKQLDFSPTSEPFERLPTRYSQAFTARYTTYLQIKVGGKKPQPYKFYLESNKCAKLYVNGDLTVEGDEEGTANLTMGEHLIQVEYFAGGPGEHCLTLKYSGLQTKPEGSDDKVQPEVIIMPPTVMRYYLPNSVALPRGNPLHKHDKPVKSLGWTHDDTFLVSTSMEGNICTWDVCKAAFSEQVTTGVPIACSAVGRKSKILATGHEDGSIQPWDVMSGSELGPLASDLEAPVQQMAFNHDDSMLAAISNAGHLAMYSVSPTGEIALKGEILLCNPVGRVGDPIEQLSVDFSCDGKLLCSGGVDGVIRLWDPEKVDPVRGEPKILPLPEEPEEGWGEEGPPEPEYAPGDPVVLQGHKNAINYLAFSPVEANVLSTASRDATIRVWDIESKTERIEPIQCLSNFVCWSPDAATLVSSNEDIFVQLWSAVSGRPRSEPCPGHLDPVLNACFAPFGQALATCSATGQIRMWHFLVNRNIAEISQLEGEQMVFQDDMKKWQKVLNRVRGECTDYEKGASHYAEDVVYLRESLDGGVSRVKSFHQREKLLGLDESDYWELDGMIDDYGPYYQLWSSVINFQNSQHSWQVSPMKSINAEEVENLLDTWFKDCYKMIKGFDTDHTRPAQKVAKKLKEGIDNFKIKFPFLRAFCNEAILPRHWEVLFSRMGISAIGTPETTTMSQMLDADVLKFTEDFEELSAAASKEFSLRKALAGMKVDWEPLLFSTTLYKETGCCILKGIDEIQTVLDDHIVKTQAIRSSPFCKPFESDVLHWEATLLYLQDFIDQTLAVQRTWMQLEPIFVSDDIKRQLPHESEAFAKIDIMFRQRMGQVASDPNCVAVAKIKNIVEDMTGANNALEKIQKGLKDYLETKRLYFPRFFFLNDADLLSILAETKDPTLVQPHMSKAFEGVASVKFEDANSVIGAMVSAEGEVVDFTYKVDVEKPENKGNVEKWLLEVEECMLNTLTDVISASNRAYAVKPRTEWCIEWPGQVVLATDCIYWTKEVTDALIGNVLGKYEQKLNSQLMDIVQLVRGDLTKLARETLGAMVTIDVHARDVVTELVQNNIKSPDEFDWLAQLRYYWKDVKSFVRRDTGLPNEKEECQVSIVNSTLLYGFEYLGNTPRLVITPLTDRCYRTLMGAFALYYGGAPEGPAGTGKTESTKDLAKALAIQCVVFNCSDGMDYLQMAKFFKGLASSGAWCCFDEFNRINLEVLSVIAQQIQSISLAIKQRVKKFVFEDTEIRLIPSCAVNITMNPGYAGRSELPDNLKALFRPCAMMVPNYSLIAEITLYSYGYQDARRIGDKATQALRLSSEQLSAQDHYDFGMRGLKSLLVAGGALKRKYGDQYPEDVIALRAFTDVNLPKFTSADIPLFKGIIGDLFPGVELPPSDYGPLMAQVETCAIKRGLQPIEPFINKVIQLWETVMVRHGLMTVGLPPCGKSMVRECLADTLAQVADGGDVFMPVTQHVMNPKSITQGQLYGEADLNTQEWTDGVLAIAVRMAAKGPPGRRQWVVLDGPVDAIWIENMNTVLDDNKKLCLNSGEIIKLSSTTTMIFEVRDLQVASPATVSRCGMVFMEPEDLGWIPLVKSWIQYKIPEYVRADHGDQLWNLFDKCFPCLLECTHRVKTPVAVNDNWLADSSCRLMSALFEDSEETYCRPPDSEEEQSTQDREMMIHEVFFFAMMWTCGACTDTDGRNFIDTVVRQMMENRKEFLTKFNFVASWEPIELSSGTAVQTAPKKGTIHDFYIDAADSGKWRPWTDKIGNFDIPREAQFHTIIVPTSDTVRNQFLIRSLIQGKFNVLMSGVTGTGKTVSIQGMLLDGFSKDTYVSMAFAFSAQTTANQTQDIIDGKLDKRRKGVYGPPLGKQMLIFCDDLNMPAKETYGAQPPIEILRQAMFMGGWYDRKTWEFRQFIDLLFLGAMGPPGGGKNDITDRYSRHFNLVFVTPFDDESLIRIFSTVVTKFLGAMAREVAGQAQAVVTATLEVYNTISSDLLPTPAKSHYTFNLRDLSKVFQGVCQCSRESLPKIDDLVKVWIHECQRVFEDRLINRQDHNWFTFLMKRLMDKHFKKQWDQTVKLEPIIFTDFVDPKSTAYTEVADHQKMNEKVSDCLEDYNAVSKLRMDLVLFTAFIQHICRVIRVLRLPLGNALCIGVGGSGRKSTTMLATFVADYTLFQIEIAKGYGMNEWRDDMKRLLMSAGCQDKRMVFLFPDTQIAKESFLEDVSSILNTGEVPNLYANEDRMEIMEKCSKGAQAAGKQGPNEIFAWYVEQCRKNLHVVLAMSPIGDQFRRRLRMFPSLVNCCTIDWYMEWPPEALNAVAMQFLKNQDMPENVLAGVVKIMVDMQTSVFELTERFLVEAKRYYYVTPTSYLELIQSFIIMLKQQRQVVKQAKWRYDVGLEKLADTASQVASMQKELEDLQPVLEKAAKDTADMMVLVERQQGEAEEKQKLVDVEARLADAQAEEATAIKADCEKDLAAAMPALEAAVDALSKLSKGDITEVKAMKTPPSGVILVAQALCYMFQVKPAKVPAPDGKGKIDDFWGPASKEILGDPRLLDKLINFDKDNIPESTITKVKPLYDDPAFEPEMIKKASIAAMGICKWVRAMVIYDKVAKEVGPKRAALAKAEKSYQDAVDKLSAKQAELAEVISLVEKLVADLEEAKARMSDLQKQSDDCNAKLIRAEKLITGLGGEKSRWTAASNKLGRDYNNLTGDILIASGIIAYLGVFTAWYRDSVTTKWLQMLQDLKIPASPQFSLQVVVGDLVKIRQWVIDKLPNDSLSIDNAIIMSNSRRWPLMIDPQQQANKWIKNSEKEGLRVLRLNQNYARDLENCIQFGNPVLIENIAEALDPMLDPLLQKATFKQGNMEMIRLGDSTIEWSKDFRLYFTTKLPNPHYQPEVCVSVVILNFMATIDGLQDQMLGIVVAKEEPEIEAKRESLVIQSAQSKAQLKEIEDRILALLSSATGNILDDEELIETLSNSKIASQKIEEQVQQQERTAAQIQETRQSYRPLALRSAALFFVVSDLCIVDPMYQYSLDWFIMIFVKSIDVAEAAPGQDERMKNLAASCLSLLYVMICRSLFEKDRLLFSMQLCFKMQEVDKDLNFKQMRLFLTGGGAGVSEDKPDAPWLTEVSWAKVNALQASGDTFDGFADSFKAHIDGWKNVFDSDDPKNSEWPQNFEKKCTPLEKALVLLAVRPDAVVEAIQDIVEAKMGKYFLEPPPFDLEACYNDSTSSVPLVFVLSSGSDPMADVIKLAEGRDMLSKIVAISLGQGQGPKAVAALKDGTSNGKWVLLQNCHLAVSWMPTLEKVVEEFREDEMNPEFRLWLTAMPSPDFPISVLQNGIKMTVEPPKGLKQSLLRAYLGMDSDWFESCSKSHEFKKLCFGLCFFHAVILERRQFGPLGWNIPYQFSEPDREISRQQLKNFLDDFEGIPWKALNYMAAEANYGGRVTDANDRRTIVHILTDYYSPEILKDEYKFSISGKYFAPQDGNLQSYVDYIRSLPLNQAPEVFWLHQNANLTAAINEGMEILRVAVQLMPKAGGGGDEEEGEKEKTPEEIFSEAAADIVAKLPPLFDIEAAMRKYPVRYDQCLNTVLAQELLKFNRLLNKITDTLINVQKAVKGLVVFSAELEEVGQGLFDNKVPGGWMKVSYPSLKPLASYISDFIARLQFFQDWIKEGIPSIFWFSGYFFQQAFLTGVKQNFARKDKIAIDRCIWNMEVLPRQDSYDEPAKGCIVRGLFMDGARWDDDAMVVADSLPKVLLCDMPCMWLIPCEIDKDATKYDRIYTCPVYKTSERRGTLSTSGHSTNHVMNIFLPISKEHSEKFWVRRGVALLTQTDD